MLNRNSLRGRSRAALATAAVLAATLSACQSNNAAPSGRQTTERPPTTAPAALRWQLGGAWTGPYPPAVVPLPGPTRTVILPDWTSTAPLQAGYRYGGSVTFGVPLHYQIPGEAVSCEQAGRYDQPPGQDVVPIAVTLVNLLAQQAPAPLPTIWATEPDGSSLTVTGYDGGTMGWRDAGCPGAGGISLAAHSSDIAYGVIGPATPAQLQHATVYIAWGVTADPSQAVVAKPLPLLVPAMKQVSAGARSSLDRAWIGRWTGKLSQPGFGVYPVTMTIKSYTPGSTDTDSYPTLKCKGKLSVDSVTPGVLTMTETITVQPPPGTPWSCISGGTITLAATRDGVAEYSWAGNSTPAHGTVTRG